MKKYIALLLLFLSALALISCAKPVVLSPEEEWIAMTSKTYGAMTVSSEKIAFNYLTGEMNLAEDRVGKRPYSVSVNNISGGWPQSGISVADIVVEIETEGGITRLMCLFTDTREIPYIGSIRSLRDQFMEALYPIDPIFVHIGTSILADKSVNEHGIRTLDGDYLRDMIYFDRARYNQGYNWEYCSFTSGQQIFDAVQKTKMSEDSKMKAKSYFNFTEDELIVPETGEANEIRFLISREKMYDGDFRYDEATKTYLKWQNGKPQKDKGDPKSPIDVQLAFTNVFVLFANITVLSGMEGLVNVDYQSGGTGYYFSEGRYEAITWSKGDYESTFHFTKADGTDLVVNTGKSYLCMARTENAEKITIL